MYHQTRLEQSLVEITLLEGNLFRRTGAGAAEREKTMPINGFEDMLRVLEREVAGEKLVTRHVLEQNRRNVDELLAMKSEIRAMKSEIHSVIARLDYISGDVALIYATVGKHTTVLNVLMQDVSLLRTTQNALAQNVVEVRIDLNGLKQDVGALKLDVSTLKQDVGALKQEMGAMREEIHMILAAVTSREPPTAQL